MQTYRKSKHVEVPGEGRKCGSDLRDRAPGRMLAVWLINYVSIRGSNKLLKSVDLALKLNPGEGGGVASLGLHDLTFAADALKYF